MAEEVKYPKRTRTRYPTGAIMVSNRIRDSRYDRDTEYIGRPSALGNPFKIGRDGTREEVIEKYRNWLRNRLTGKMFRGTPPVVEFDRLYAKYIDTGELRLICWCAPLPCHGDVIAEFIEEREKYDD